MSYVLTLKINYICNCNSAPAAHGNKVFFHLKASGSWTKQVIEEAKKQDDGLLQVRLDGFYGVNSGVCDKLQDKDGIILVGGGIGVTPMMSLAMELNKTSPLLPITLMWVARTVEEFSIFSEELAIAMHSNKNFKAKVWITNMKGVGGGALPEQSILKGVNDPVLLAGNNRINNVKLSDIDSMGQVASVKQHLETVKSSHIPQNVTSPLFELDKPSLTGSANAFVMATSILLATVAYALSAQIANKESFSDTIQDKISLMDLSLVCVFVLVWIAVVVLLRSVLTRYLVQKDNENFPAKTIKELDQTERTISISKHSVFSQDVENNAGSEDKAMLLESILEGCTIGSRPNIPVEFSSFSRSVVKSAGKGTANMTAKYSKNDELS